MSDEALITLNPQAARTATALFEHLFPAGTVNRNLRVHDTPRPHVFSGAFLSTCAEVKPTPWALSRRARERLIEQLPSGEEARG
jgi:hypothetical protein